MLLVLFKLLTWAVLSWTAQAMRQDHLGRLRRETVDMFYHGFDNYMEHAFPEDEVCRTSKCRLHDTDWFLDSFDL